MDKTLEEKKVEKKIGQLQNQQKILLNRKRTEEHRARTHRLIERGAILEADFPPNSPGAEIPCGLFHIFLPGYDTLFLQLSLS